MTRTSYTLEEWRQKCARYLRACRDLQQGWNGYNADPIDPRLIDRATEMLATWPELEGCFVVPTARDSMQFEWRQGPVYFEFELYLDPERYGLLYVPNEDEDRSNRWVENDHLSEEQLRAFMRERNLHAVL